MATDIDTKKNEIILYQPDNSIELEVLVENDTVWLSQDQIAFLFGTQRPAITKHLGNIFKSGELNEKEVCPILELTTIHGAIAEKTHIGASFKDLGKKLFAFSKMEMQASELLKNI